MPYCRICHKLVFSSLMSPEGIQHFETAFENSDFYREISLGTEESLLHALEIIYDETFDVTVRSHQEETKGWTYLHLVVDKYMQMKEEDEETARLLIRALYRLALVGCDANARDDGGLTALIKSARILDQNLMTHLIRIGMFPYR